MPTTPTKNNDLFPETLLVDIADGHTFTTSIKVAEHFQKNHQHVLRNIKKLTDECPDKEFSLSNFGQSTYTNERGKTYPMFTLTEEGFALLAMGFTGKQALQWKIDFLTAFRSMETALKQRVERRANALRYLRPYWLTIEQGTDDGLSRRDLCALTGHKSPDTITANKRRMRAAGLLH
jgi:Rha family phage regulatory protein